MKNKTKKSVVKLTILGLFIIGLMFFIYSIYISTLKPAYVSYADACLEKEIEGYVTMGTTSINPETREVEIEITEQQSSFIKVIQKHEYVHKKQIEGNRLLPCNFGLLYFSELEAYTMMILPDTLFIPIYGNYTKYFSEYY